MGTLASWARRFGLTRAICVLLLLALVPLRILDPAPLEEIRLRTFRSVSQHGHAGFLGAKIRSDPSNLRLALARARSAAHPGPGAAGRNPAANLPICKSAWARWLPGREDSV